MSYIAVDPGNIQSAYVLYEDGKILQKGILPNLEMRDLLFFKMGPFINLSCPEKLYIEMVASYGMPVGVTTFETVFWTGRFVEAWQGPYEKVYRQDVKLGLCASMRAKDSNIRQFLIDKFGPPGTKKKQGTLYGVSKDIWAALAIAVYIEQRGQQHG